MLSNRQMSQRTHDHHVQIIDALRGPVRPELVCRIGERRNLSKLIYLAELERCQAS